MRKRTYLPWLALFFAVVLIASWGYDALGGESRVTATASGTAKQQEQRLDEYVFPKDKVTEVKITIDEDDFRDMLDNAATEEMKTVSVDYNGIKMDNVGFRTKGNISLSSVVNSDSDRYSFKLSFDEYISSQTMMGISKINLNNSFSDPTYIREVLAYETAEEMGLPVPKYSFVNLYINDELWGFYLAVEQIGDAYLRRHFGSSTGSLYKAIQGSGTELAWYGENRESYAGLVQKSDYADDGALINMLNMLNNGTAYEDVLDVSNVLKYIALNVVTANTDSYIGPFKHNYYLFEQNGVFSVLPWDYNMAFGGMGNMAFGGAGGRTNRGGGGDAPDGGGAAAPGNNADNGNNRTGGRKGGMGGGFGGGGGGFGSTSVTSPAGNQNRPLVSKLLALDEYREEYYGYVREALEGYLDPETFNRRVDEWADLIREYVKRDPRPFFTYEQFESGLESLKAANAGNVSRFLQELEDAGAAGGSSGSRADEDRQPEEKASAVTVQSAENVTLDVRTATLQIPQMPDAGNGEGGRPGFPGGGQGGFQGGFPGGFPGEFPGDFQGGFPGGAQGAPGAAVTADQQERLEAFYIVLISLGLMALAAVFILTYKRKRI